jgi:hypothetical protein
MLHARTARFVTVVFRKKFLDLNTPLVIGVHGYKQIVWHVAALFKFLMKYHVLGSCPTSMACSPCSHMLIYIPKWSAYMKRWELFKFWRSFGITSTITFVRVWIEPFADTNTALHCSWWNLSEFLLKFGRCLTLSNAPHGSVCDYVVPSYPWAEL